MSAGWVAATVRARALAGRRLGPDATGQLAGQPGLAAALDLLSRSSYADAVGGCVTSADARRAVAGAALWNLRVLAGWLPPGGAELLRVVAAWFELANIEDRWAELEGAAVSPPFELGALAGAWPRASRASTPGQLRAALAASPWGDPGTTEPGLAGVVLRLAWARRLAATLPDSGSWAAGQAALMAALLVGSGATGGLGPAPAATARRLLGSGWAEAPTVADLAARVPRPAAWALAGVEGPEDLWQAQLRWWDRVEADGMRRRAGAVRPGSEPVVGIALALVADAWRVGAALDAAARRADREQPDVAA
ncbi:MAG TPA: hypothetical protein VFH58_15105 [Acidimicrobiales bacterium]|nr:hypothetical protein [Acidimicrobiales bacterium]